MRNDTITLESGFYNQRLLFRLIAIGPEPFHASSASLDRGYPMSHVGFTTMVSATRGRAYIVIIANKWMPHQASRNFRLRWESTGLT